MQVARTQPDVPGPKSSALDAHAARTRMHASQRVTRCNAEWRALYNMHISLTVVNCSMRPPAQWTFMHLLPLAYS